MDKSVDLSGDDEITPKLLFHYVFFVSPERSFANRYGFALLVTIFAFGLRDFLGGNLIYRFPFGFFIPATLLAAWYGGFGAGVTSFVSGALLGLFFFLEPHNGWGPLTTYGAWALCIYLLTSSTAICLITLEQARNWKLAQELAELRERLIQALTK